MLRGVDVFAGFLVLLERENALDRIRIVSRVTGVAHDVGFPEAAYSIQPSGNAEYEASRYRFRYQSLITPATVYEHDVATRENVLLKRQPVLGGYDPAHYALERFSAAAPDGAEVPITIAYRKNAFRRDGCAPLHLVGYGAYGFGVPVTFSSNRVSLMDRGVTVGIAHVRGGDELGKVWHDQGRMGSKQNTFTDFISCAEHLIAAKYTSADRLVVEGGSAGGLLIGAALNLRPELFGAAVLKVPFVDVINTMLDETLPLTVGEFEEWGNPKRPADYAYMKSYCPYTNLRAAPYPAILVKTSTEDSQVMYWEPAKYVARLRTMKTDANPLLFKVNFSAGHGGASGRYDALKDTAFDYAFMLTRLGLGITPRG
jgi:oligopeptidase B